VDRVILVGGATRMSAMRSLAARIFRKLPERLVDPDHAIALGAAVQAGLADRHADLRELVMTDVAPFSLGAEVSDTVGEHIVHGGFSAVTERNTVLPVSCANVFSAGHARQKEIALRIFQGEAAMAADNVLLGEKTIRLPRGGDARQVVEVRFSYDVSGLLAIDVEALSTGEVISHVTERLAGAMTDAEKARKLAELDAIKISPRDDAPNIALMERLKHLHEVLLGGDRQEVMRLIARFDAAMASQDQRRIVAERKAMDLIAREIEDGYVR
jgi:molecular chaperone HscC